jgi:hypothetical protein
VHYHPSLFTTIERRDKPAPGVHHEFILTDHEIDMRRPILLEKVQRVIGESEWRITRAGRETHASVIPKDSSLQRNWFGTNEYGVP